MSYSSTYICSSDSNHSTSLIYCSTTTCANLHMIAESTATVEHESQYRYLQPYFRYSFLTLNFSAPRNFNEDFPQKAEKPNTAIYDIRKHIASTEACDFSIHHSIQYRAFIVGVIQYCTFILHTSAKIHGIVKYATIQCIIGCLWLLHWLHYTKKLNSGTLLKSSYRRYIFLENEWIIYLWIAWNFTRTEKSCTLLCKYITAVFFLV